MSLTAESVLAQPDTFPVPADADTALAAANAALDAALDHYAESRWQAFGTALTRFAPVIGIDATLQVGTRWMTNRPDTSVRPDRDTLRALLPPFREAGLIPEYPGR